VRPDYDLGAGEVRYHLLDSSKEPVFHPDAGPSPIRPE
jgi:hypothetical protein